MYLPSHTLLCYNNLTSCMLEVLILKMTNYYHYHINILLNRKHDFFKISKTYIILNFFYPIDTLPYEDLIKNFSYISIVYRKQIKGLKYPLTQDLDKDKI